MNIEKLIEQYKFIRDEIKHEYKLISDRNNSLMVPQAFLFTALVIGIPKNDYFQIINSVYYPLLPIIAIFLLIIPQLGICAALRRIESWRIKQNLIEIKINKIASDESELYIQKSQIMVHFLGRLTSFISPIFLFSWLYILQIKLNYVMILTIVYILIICIIAYLKFLKNQTITILSLLNDEK